MCDKLWLNHISNIVNWLFFQPRIAGGPFRINVSEQTLPGSTILSKIEAKDDDQQGPYSTLTFSALDSLGKPSVS